MLVGQPPPHVPNNLKDSSQLQEDNLQSSQDYSWMFKEGLLVPQGQMRQDQTRLQSWPAQAPSHLKDGSQLQDNLRSPHPGRLMVDEGQLVQGTGKY